MKKRLLIFKCKKENNISLIEGFFKMIFFKYITCQFFNLNNV